MNRHDIKPVGDDGAGLAKTVLEKDRQIASKVREQVREKARNRGIYEERGIRSLIREELTLWMAKEYLPLRSRVFIGKRVFDSILGLDILQPLAEDERVTDIMVNGYRSVFYVKEGKMYPYPDAFETEERLEDLIQQIVGSVNRSVNEANPIVDARLEDGSRVNVVLPPVSLCGATLTIRKFRKDPISMEELIANGTITLEAAEYLKKAVAERKNLFVCGGTSSGKTTLLNILSGYIHPSERVVTIEDSAELRLTGLPNVVTLETRNQGVDGKGGITLRDLIKTSLRMNTDRIIVGEVRGKEALDMLSGMNTGHAGMSTGHANSCRDMLGRLETMVWMGAADIPLEAIRQQIASALDLMVFVEKERDGQRRLTEIVKVMGVEQGQVKLEPIMWMKEGKTVWQGR